MKKLKGLTVLMAITLAVITCFQAYWLKNNYDREKRAMHIKANMSFQEAVRQLQVSKLKLKDPSIVDSLHKGKMRVFIDDHHEKSDMKIKVMPKTEIVTMVNAMRDKIRDSLKDAKVNSAVVISMNKESVSRHTDTLTFENRIDGNKIFQFLYGVDSLQDSLKIPEIISAYQKKLDEDDLPVTFNIVRLDKTGESDEPEFSNVTVGFVRPVTYHLEIVNSFSYLMKRITLPILFSIFLVGVTVLSFLLLYRNLLKQQRLAELKNEFISNITHELKTPIATVGVAIEALRNFNAMQNPEKTKEYLDISANELQRLSLLVDKVLKLSMFEKKEVELKKESFDMQELITEVLSIMKLQFEKYNATVRVITEGNNFLIEADRLHITSVLYNLLDNALKYSRENPVIDVKLSALPLNVIELKVSDRGIGIAKEFQRKIFDKFFRVPMGDRHNIKGYGLGLSYVSEIVRRHMGYIEVHSEIGKGTTFTVTLPRKEADVVYLGDKRKIIKEEVRFGLKKG